MILQKNVRTKDIENWIFYKNIKRYESVSSIMVKLRDFKVGRFLEFVCSFQNEWVGAL